LIRIRDIFIMLNDLT